MVAVRSIHDAPPAAIVDRAFELGVPVGLAVLTWLALLLAVGFLARLTALSFLNVLPVFVVGLLFWPVYRAAPWRAGMAERVRRWSHDRTTEVGVLVGLGLVPLVPVVPDLLVTLLQLPYRGSGIFFGASLFYRQRLGPTAGRLLLVFAQTYLQVIWLYLLSKGVVGLARRLR